MWPLPQWFPLRSTALPHPVVSSSIKHFRVLLVRRGVHAGGPREAECGNVGSVGGLRARSYSAVLPHVGRPY